MVRVPGRAGGRKTFVTRCRSSSSSAAKCSTPARKPGCSATSGTGRELLSGFGLESMAKTDRAYDPVDYDNGGGGCFTAFPAQIAERLYKAGHPRASEDILRRILWWGERVPYWGDSFAANEIQYRRDTPLQCTIDAAAGAVHHLRDVRRPGGVQRRPADRPDPARIRTAD